MPSFSKIYMQPFSDILWETTISLDQSIKPHYHKAKYLEFKASLKVSGRKIRNMGIDSGALPLSFFLSPIWTWTPTAHSLSSSPLQRDSQKQGIKPESWAWWVHQRNWKLLFCSLSSSLLSRQLSWDMTRKNQPRHIQGGVWESSQWPLQWTWQVRTRWRWWRKGGGPRRLVARSTYF